MSVIIKDMEMPKVCFDCPCHDGETGRCNILKITTDYIPKNCPLEEVADVDAENTSCVVMRDLDGRQIFPIRATNITTKGPVETDVAPVIHAHWVQGAYLDGDEMQCDCSHCNMPNNGKKNFCPNCGAIMDEEVD